MKSIDRKYLYIAAGVIVLILFYFGFWRESPILVEAGEASFGEVLDTVDAEARTRYQDRFVVTAPVSGKMFRVQLHEGDAIPKGYVITRIDPSPQRPTDPLQSPESPLAPYAYNVYAPTDGRLTRIFETSERIIAAGTPIAEISKPSRLEIVADVLSEDATKIRPTMDVIVENWGGSEPAAARVRTIEPRAFTKVSALGVEEQRVNVIADFLKVPERIGDNFRVDVRIVVWKGSTVLRVPTSALFRTGDEWSVFVIERGRARTRAVKIGHRSPSFVEVLSGIADGETVVLHPPNTIADGTRVSSRN